MIPESMETDPNHEPENQNDQDIVPNGSSSTEQEGRMKRRCKKERVERPTIKKKREPKKETRYFEWNEPSKELEEEYAGFQKDKLGAMVDESPILSALLGRTYIPPSDSEDELDNSCGSMQASNTRMAHYIHTELIKRCHQSSSENHVPPWEQPKLSKHKTNESKEEKNGPCRRLFSQPVEQEIETTEMEPLPRQTLRVNNIYSHRNGFLSLFDILLNSDRQISEIFVRKAKALDFDLHKDMIYKHFLVSDLRVKEEILHQAFDSLKSVQHDPSLFIQQPMKVKSIVNSILHAIFCRGEGLDNDFHMNLSEFRGRIVEEKETWMEYAF